jgi:hypothetical protein
MELLLGFYPVLLLQHLCEVVNQLQLHVRLHSADTCSIAGFSVGVSRGHSSKILGCGFGTIDVPVP